jgi:hypothetical protein
MRKILFLLLCLPTTVFSCAGYVIGFKGIDNAFDQTAFISYADRMGYCGKSYSWNEIKSPTKLISSTDLPYQLYGYSMGALSIRNFLKTNIRKPEFILTIGAYRTTNVNFDSYGVRYKNYFDHSGMGQTSPGIFLNVPHDKIQHEVNKIIWGQQRAAELLCKHLVYKGSIPWASTNKPGLLFLRYKTASLKREHRRYART